MIEMLDDLIASLIEIRNSVGNVPVAGSGFLGTNNGHSVMKLESLPTEDSLTEDKVLHLHFSLAPDSRKRIVEGIEDMQRRGYTYYPSQFVGNGERPRTGVSSCEWHNPW